MKLENSSHRKDGFIVGRRRILNAVCAVAGMHDGISAHIDSHMAAVADDIARLHLRCADAVAHASQRAGGVGKGYAEILIYAHDKSGTVSSFC